MIVDTGEISALAARYGEPRRWSRVLDVMPEFVEDWQARARRKRGEAVLVILRPNARVLLHTKEFYPAGAYRLLSGGIEPGERVEDAARRELREETGLDAALDRFLGIIDYEFRHLDASAVWVSYVFLTMETRDQARVVDPHERIAGFREIEWRALGRTADTLEQLPDDWLDWGRLRAIPHRLALEAISEFGLRIPD